MLRTLKHHQLLRGTQVVGVSWVAVRAGYPPWLPHASGVRMDSSTSTGIVAVDLDSIQWLAGGMMALKEWQ